MSRVSEGYQGDVGGDSHQVTCDRAAVLGYSANLYVLCELTLTERDQVRVARLLVDVRTQEGGEQAGDVGGVEGVCTRPRGGQGTLMNIFNNLSTWDEIGMKILCLTKGRSFKRPGKVR